MNKYDQKFIERWAKLYIARYSKNSEEAIAWGMTFFPDDLIPLVIEQSKKELKKRGLRPKPEPELA
jgi:hypothetical protein